MTGRHVPVADNVHAAGRKDNGTGARSATKAVPGRVLADARASRFLTTSVALRVAGRSMVMAQP